jgi:CrcB protein
MVKHEFINFTAYFKPMKVLLAIGTGSFIGGILRYLISVTIQHKTTTSFPLGTLAVNLIGCLLIGVAFGFADHGKISSAWKFFMVTGILGGFTTFSAFSNETFQLMRDGHFVIAFSYVGLSVVVGLFATFLGFMLTRLVTY